MLIKRAKNYCMKKIIFALAALFIAGACYPQDGTPDPTFGTGGFIKTIPQLPPQPIQSFAKQCFVRADGKIDIVIWGNATQITRRLSNGQLDATYAYGGYSQIVSMIPTCATIQPDGKIVVGGSTNGSGNFMIARYQVNGDLDSSFGAEGVVIANVGTAPEFLNAIAISPTGKIIAGGSRENGNVSQFIVVQFTQDGTPDASFGSGGIATANFNGSSASVTSLAIQADGKIITAGSAYSNSLDFAMARFNPDGSADLSLNGTGLVTSDFGFDDQGESVITDGAKIYVGGFSSDASGFQHFRVARYNTDGTPDVTYNGGSVLAVFGDSYDVLLSMKLDATGKIVAAGRTNLFSANNDVAVVRINSDGTLDNTFGSFGNGLAVGDFNGRADESVYLAIQPDGKILTGGDSQDYNTATYSFYSCFRFNTNGSPDTGFGTNGVVEDAAASIYDSYNSLLGQTDGKVTGVNFVSNGITAANFANRFKANGTPDSSFGQNGVKQLGTPTSSVYFQPDGKFLSVDFSTYQITRYNTDGSIDAGFGTGGTIQTPNAGFPAFQPDGKILIGSFINTADNKADFLISRYNADGSLDNTFGNAGFSEVNADTIDNLNSISVAPDGKIIVGGTSYIFPPDFSFFQSEIVVLRLNSDGTPDATFGNGGIVRVFRGNDDFIGSALAQNDNKIVLTYYIVDNISGQENIFIERLNADGTVDTSFGQNGQTGSDGGYFVIQTDQKIVIIGGQVTAQNTGNVSISRINPDGTLDPTFGTNGKTISTLPGMSIGVSSPSLSGNSLFIGGSGFDKTGAQYAILAKYLLGSASPLSCPANRVVNTDNNRCDAKVTGIDPTIAQSGQTVKYKLTGATSGSGNGSVSGKIFNKGVTTVTYMLSNDKTKTCSFTVTVLDKQPPVINGFTVSPSTLSPPDHKMRNVVLNYSLSDNCGIGVVQLSVNSNEPVQSNEQGDQSPDWQIIDNHNIKLRSESLASGNGRIYTITLTVTDLSGNQSSATTTVTVPKSGGNNCNLQISASPNPSHDYFLVRVNSDCSDKMNVRLLDNRGNVLSSISDLTPPQTLKFGIGLRPGIYFVQVTQAGITQTLQLIKQ